MTEPTTPAQRPAAPETQLVVALDLPGRALRAMVDQLPEVRWFKIGLEAYLREGAALVEWLTARGANVFLDLKLHDIPHTVSRATAVVAGLGARLLTVHAGGGPEMVAAAVESARATAPDLRVLGVTLLTSLQGDELPGVWDPRTSITEKVVSLARLTADAGGHGVVASPREAAALRAEMPRDFLIVCPGVRGDGDRGGDQRRVATVPEAIAAGATHLVIGRPITRAPDPEAACAAILREIRRAHRSD